jgi:phosphoglycolate phosphatase
VKPIVVFDLDGTLADTAPDLVATLNVVLGREGVAPLALETARDLIGDGAKALIRRGLEVSGQTRSPERLEVMFQDFLGHYGRDPGRHSNLFPGVRESLDALRKEAYGLAVCTNKMAQHAKILLEQLDIAHYFSVICGRDSFTWHKPDPRHLTATIVEAGYDPRHAVLVGDSQTDIDTARAADIPVLGVTFGYTRIPMSLLVPDILIEDYSALLPAIRRILPV